MKDFGKQNVAPLDQWLRYGVGLVLISLAGAGIIGVWGFLPGGIALVTAALRYSPLYDLLGVATRVYISAPQGEWE